MSESTSIRVTFLWTDDLQSIETRQRRLLGCAPTFSGFLLASCDLARVRVDRRLWPVVSGTREPSAGTSHPRSCDRTGSGRDAGNVHGSEGPVGPARIHPHRDGASGGIPSDR